MQALGPFAQQGDQGDTNKPDENEMDYTIEVEQEADGRWLAEVPELPGVLAYGATVDEAQSRAETLALRVLAERLT